MLIPRNFKQIFLILFISISIFGKLAYGLDDGTLPWYVPHHVKLQFAGSIGFISPGIGYTFFKDRTEIELFGGYVPKSIGGATIRSMSLKLNGKIIKLKPWDQITVYPLDLGVVLNYTFGKQYYFLLPYRYPGGYYFWSSALRIRPAIGGSLEKELIRNSFLGIKSIGCYYELSTAGLYLVTLFHNPTYVDIFPDVISLGLGIKLSFK